MLEAGHDLIFPADERKTKGICAQQGIFLCEFDFYTISTLIFP